MAGPIPSCLRHQWCFIIIRIVAHRRFIPRIVFDLDAESGHFVDTFPRPTGLPGVFWAVVFIVDQFNSVRLDLLASASGHGPQRLGCRRYRVRSRQRC
jgi:hypothetical protein